MTRDTTGAAGNPAAVRCAGPGDALDVIPWMLGFHPTESLVMLGLVGPRSAFGPILRFDLPDPGLEGSLIRQAVRLLKTTPSDEVLFVVYTDEGSADPLSQLPRQSLLLEAREQLKRAGFSIRDAVVVRHGRWVSLLCDDPLCCPAEGTPVGHDSPSAVELACLAAGAGPPMPSRDAVVQSLVAQPNPAVEAELERLTRDAGGLDVGSQLDQLHQVFDHAMTQHGAPLAPAVIAMLIFLAQCVPCRDAAAELPCADELAEAIAIWREVYVAAPPAFRPQVGSILGVLAWAAGGGVLATSVCESVLEADPAHSLTLLIADVLNHRVKAPPRPSRAEAEADARSAMRKLARRQAQHPRRGSRGNGGWRRRPGRVG